MKCIYRLEGDKLIIAMPNVAWEGERPKDFTSPDGDPTNIVLTFAQVPTKKAEAPTAKALPSLAGGMINDGLVRFAAADASVYETSNTIDETILRPFLLRSTGELKDLGSLNK
jgi:hypothetical protein